MPRPPSIPRRVFQGLLIVLFAVTVLLPLFAQITGIPRDRRLGGFRYRIREFPAWTFKSWRRGIFASTTDAWIAEHVGLRGWMVSLDRQLRYELFGQMEPTPRRKRSLVLGTPPHLHENLLMIDARRPAQVEPAVMDAFAARLARTRELLNEQGIAFLVVIAPNKVLLYPDTLPAWARRTLNDDDTDYQEFARALQRHGVPHLNTMELFKKLAPTHRDLVPPHGIHWSHRGAWIAWQHTIPLLNEQGILPPLPVPATLDLVYDKPSSMNDELRGQLNCFTSPYHAPVPSAYPVAEPLPEGFEPVIEALIVGDSFAFTYIDAMARSRLCNTMQLWFYMRSLKVARQGSFDSSVQRGISHVGDGGRLRANVENTELMLKDKNVVLLVMTTFNIDKLSWRFDKLVDRLYGGSEEEVEELDDDPFGLKDEE